MNNLLGAILIAALFAVVVGVGLFMAVRKSWWVRDWTRVSRIRCLLVWLLGLTAIILARQGFADQTFQDFGITNTVRSNTVVTVNLGSGLKIDSQDNCSVLLSGSGSTAGNAGLVTVKFARSLDGTNWETHPLIPMIATVFGVTNVIEFTNLTSSIVGAAGWIKPVSIQNADTIADWTNVVLQLGKKNPRRAP